VALMLKKRGIDRVRPLTGGIEAWVASGRAVEPIDATDPFEEKP